MANDARRQHLVSKFYLRRFADDDKLLVRTELPGIKSHAISINNATVSRDFYSLPTASGELSDFFERQFADIEGAAATGFRMMVDEGTWPLSGEPRLAVATWIALQYLRTESVRNSQSEYLEQMIKLTVGISGKAALREHIESHEGRCISDARLAAEWDDLTKLGGPTLRPNPRQHIKMMYNLLAPTALMLTDRQWSLTAFTRKRLLTCDNPVSLHVRDDYPKYLGIGLATADAYLVPVSPAHSLLIGASPQLPDMRIPGTASLAKSVVQHTILNARSAVYWHPRDSAQLQAYPLPEPRLREMDDSIGDHFINERGMFADLTDEQRRAHARGPLGDRDEERSWSLHDLPWPIPDRVFDYQEPGD